jgi:hypothetical protein
MLGGLRGSELQALQDVLGRLADRAEAAGER